jgi:hypothetical protein
VSQKDCYARDCTGGSGAYDPILPVRDADGFRVELEQLNYWMKGKPRSDRPPRWNVLDSLIGIK